MENQTFVMMKTSTLLSLEVHHLANNSAAGIFELNIYLSQTSIYETCTQLVSKNQAN